MSYQVLALKYRPQTFKEVIGQSHVTTTLTNAILSNRVAHAILFAGPRGTGKTSIARILAKAMNCASGPAPVPCNKCKSCMSITSGNSVDVFEIDGASNNSVDQIRELRSNITYLPSMSPFKIYIIDEVHMLSTAAFNALLKTLEEPPDHVLFIFATTEPHKIPVTILSRCQRHDLGRIPLSEIADQLESICTKEGYTIQRESIDIIASEADGSMRDSLSLLDRVMSSTGEKNISHEIILENLGIIDKKIIFDISKAIIDLDGAAILQLISMVHDLGLDLKKFYSDIIKQFRNLAVIKICQKNTQFTDISDSDRAIMETTVSSLSKGYLTQILNVLIGEESTIKFASHTKIALEMTLLNLLQIRQGIDIDDIITQLDFLVKHNAENKIPDSHDIYQEIGHEKSKPEKSKSEQSEAIPEAVHESIENIETNKITPAAEQMYTGKSCRDEADQKQPDTKQFGKKTWKTFIEEVRKDLPFVAAALLRCRFKEITETDIIIEGNAKPQNMSRIESKMDELKNILSRFFKHDMAIKIINPSIQTNSVPQINQVDPPSSTETKTERTPAQVKKEILSHPVVVKALEMFNGHVVDITSMRPIS